MKIVPKSQEVTFKNDILLVTKTDLKGKITYANRAFTQIVNIEEKILIGSPHNIIRHPDMPKIIFKYLWRYVQEGNEIHAYVKNLTSDGSYYWVFANVTPSYDTNSHSKIIGYHSTRSHPTKEALAIIKPLYEKLLKSEKSHGVEASEKILKNILDDKGMKYDEFILSI